MKSPFRWFAKEKRESYRPALRSVRFDTSGWQEMEVGETRIDWAKNDARANLSLDLVEGPVLPSNPHETIGGCRKIAESNGGGLISAETIQLGQRSLVKLIYKKHLQHPRRYAYTGMLIIPSGRFAWVLVMATQEHGTTGIRDALVTGKLCEEGKIEFEFYDKPQADGSSGRIKGWFQDPYNPDYKGPVLRTIADDERYDSLCPLDPLSQVRSEFLKIQASLRFEESQME